MEMRVDLAKEKGAGIIMTASDKLRVRATLGRLGFRESLPHEFFFAEGPYRQVYNPSWFVRGKAPRTPWQISTDF
jgi:hypothetical protein